MQSDWGKKNTSLVSQRGIEDDSILFSVNWYPFISWWPFESRLMYQKSNAHLSKSDKLYSPLGIFAVLRYSFMAFTKSWGLLKDCFTKSYDFTSCIRRFVLQNSLGFFPERLNWSYAPSAWIISISISGAVMTFTTSIFCSYALLNRNYSLRESKIRITEICSSNPFRKYYA